MSDSLFAKYQLERRGATTLFEEDGFVSYLIADKECFITDMYVDSEKRKGGRFWKFIDQLSVIARQAGCAAITARIHLNDPGSNRSLRAAMGLGFVVAKADQDVLIIVKYLSGENHG